MDFDWFGDLYLVTSSVTFLFLHPSDFCNTLIVGNEIHLTAHAVEATFVFHDATHAIVTFRRGQTTYVKQLKKTRDDPTVICA
jgi:hypothetical protein